MSLVIIIFILGYLTIVLEHPLKLDKTVPALIMAILSWTVISFGQLPLLDHHGENVNMEPALLYHIGKIAEIVLFLIGAMTIVELVDLHKGFSVITRAIKTQKKSKLLWIIAVLAFLLSAVLDNLTTTIVMISLLRKLVPMQKERWYYASLVVIAANAGGAWSPIGDVTTTMLWIGKNVTTVPLVVFLIIPSLACLLVPAFIVSRMSSMKGNVERPKDEILEDESNKPLAKGSTLMLIAGISALLFVPVFKTITHLPPYMGMMLSLGIVWLISEYIQPDEKFEGHQMTSAKHALSRIDTSSVLFFLGILLAVGSMESLGILSQFAGLMNAALPAETNFLPGVTGTDIVVLLLGIGSAIIDNVPLVAAAMGMYSLDEYATDSKLWHFLAYSAGTGGSMLIIGSAAGVAAMGMEKIDFMWYLKNISWIALIGFLAGAAAFFLLHPVFEGFLGIEEAVHHLQNSGGGKTH
jgi:Na+/H+ antiporter NhaD/arsenite permease-like protein